MKKGKTLKHAKIIIIAVVVIAIVCAGFFIYRSSKVKNLLHEQNYIAAKLIELGDCTQGSMLATQNEQMKSNAVSQELIVLAAGLQADYDIGMLYAEAYLEKGEDEVIASAQTIFTEYQSELEALMATDEYNYQEQQLVLEQKTYNELLGLLLSVQGDIPVKSSEKLNTIVNYMLGMSTGSDVTTVIADDNSLIAQKVQTQQALSYGNYEEAINKAETMVASNGTFENRALLANMVATSGVNMVEDTQAANLREEQNELSQQVYELAEKQNQETDLVKKRELEDRILELEQEIQELEDSIQVIPALKAINYIETTTPLKDKGSKAYKIELAKLYYQANEDEKCREILQDLIKDEDDSLEPANMLFQSLKKVYLAADGAEAAESFLVDNRTSTEEIWQQLANLLGFQQNYYYYGDDEFYQFVLTTFDEVYNGLIIRSIDATDFPVVRVTINVAMDTEEELHKSDLTLEELGEPLSDFEFLTIDEVENATDMTVELVVDKSGSMNGDPMVNTQKAVSNFIKSLNENINVGVVAFDDIAHTAAPISDNHSNSLQAVNSLIADGGTNIYAGLKLAGQELEGRSGRRVIILMSDGADGSASIIDEVLDELKRKNIYVYTIAFGGADTEYLSYIAKQCGGKCIQAESSQMLSEIYATIGEYMVNDYILEFTVVKDLEQFSRSVKITYDKKDAFAEKDYNVGVPLEDIQAEDGVRPLANYFQEIGGSDMSAVE